VTASAAWGAVADDMFFLADNEKGLSWDAAGMMARGLFQYRESVKKI